MLEYKCVFKTDVYFSMANGSDLHLIWDTKAIK